jgi:hypothetical protein
MMGPNRCRTLPVLDGKKADQNEARKRDDPGFKCRVCNGESFHGAENRNGRCNHTIPVEQSGADHAEQGDRGNVPAPKSVGAEAIRHERKEGEDTAFSVVIGAQYEIQVFDRDDKKESPDHQGENTEYVFRVHTLASGRQQAFAQRVQRAGADITENHHESAERQDDHAGVRHGIHYGTIGM